MRVGEIVRVYRNGYYSLQGVSVVSFDNVVIEIEGVKVVFDLCGVMGDTVIGIDVECGSTKLIEYGRNKLYQMWRDGDGFTDSELVSAIYYCRDVESGLAMFGETARLLRNEVRSMLESCIGYQAARKRKGDWV